MPKLKRLTFPKLLKLVDPLYEKFLNKSNVSEVDEKMFGLRLAVILKKHGWTKEAFVRAMERLSLGMTDVEEGIEDDSGS